MRELHDFLVDAYGAGTVYPPASEIFAALNHASLGDVRVVIVGQDPYHGPDQAHGLCFSVAPGVAPPPSLRNIFQELDADLDTVPESGDLRGWAEQGVLLLNTTLTVAAGKAGSHRDQGWERFTEHVLRTLVAHHQGRRKLVFLLWGRHAQDSAEFVDETKYHVLRAAHPSPLSVRNFRGCRHFSKTNILLAADGQAPIDWARSAA
jgi:uracil-DNA glycosylase